MSAEELARADWATGMSPTEVAKKHGLSVNTVKSWIKRKWKREAVEGAKRRVQTAKPPRGAGCKKSEEDAPSDGQSQKPHRGTLNLIPVNQRSEEEQYRIRSAGGRASQEKRRETKRLRECAELLLSLPVLDARKFNKLSTMGVSVEDIDNRMLLVAGLIVKAQSGDVAAAKEIRNLIGEDIIQQETSETREAAAALTTEELKDLANDITKHRE